jgi:heme-degrading monooxygenase HmoA
MYIRIVRGQPQPGQVDEVARRWKEHLGPRLGSIPGFRHAYFSGDREANRITTVSVWDDKPGEAVDQAMREFRQRVQDISVGPPTIEDNEVLAEV